MIFKGWAESPGAALAFAGSFYLLLVGSKALLACAFGRMTFLRSSAFRAVQRVLGILLCLFGLSLLREGLTLFGIIS
jgi:small neutral amino acid transporter SnatA (MarC family)